jgi:hypothetical protein
VICPNKICAQNIPDDSCFCDQCGMQLLRCEKCGLVKTGKRCDQCGGNLSAIVPSDVQKPADVFAQNISEPNNSVSSSATVVVRLPAEKIYFCNSEGWNIEITNGDILGRTNGQHTAKLGKYPVISSNHAKVMQQNNEWFIVDLNSTNKTYLNGIKLDPNVSVKIKQNDVVILANVTFTVRET